MFNWLREYLDIKREARFCESCETLKTQLSIANEEKKDLLDRLLNPIRTETEQTVDTRELKPIQTRDVAWRVRRQMLEQEDRIKAGLVREAPKPELVKTDVKTAADIEKELGVTAHNAN